MTPPTVNAYYDPSLNEMVFPAGILQPPFFDKRFAAAVNFGATGAVIGHELTHGFDDEGSQFDGTGNLRNWWSDATGKLFEEQTKCVVDQYSAYEARPRRQAQRRAHRRREHRRHRRRQARATPPTARPQGRHGQRSAPAATPRTSSSSSPSARPGARRSAPRSLRDDGQDQPPLPARFRVNGVLANIPQFAEAFSCKAGTPMHPAKTCSVW